MLDRGTHCESDPFPSGMVHAPVLCMMKKPMAGMAVVSIILLTARMARADSGDADTTAEDAWATVEKIHTELRLAVEQQGLSQEDLQRALRERHGDGCELLGLTKEHCAELFTEAQVAITDITAAQARMGPEADGAPPWGFDPRLARPRSGCRRGLGSCFLGSLIGASFLGPSWFAVGAAAGAYGCYCGYCRGGASDHICW